MTGEGGETSAWGFIAVVIVGFAAWLLWAGCAPRSTVPDHTTSSAPLAPPRPAACRDVAAGQDLQAAIDATPDGGALCLAPGDHFGPITIARGLTLWGPRTAILHTRGDGTTVRVSGAGVQLRGFTLDGSGGRFDLLDAAVHATGEDHVLEGLQVQRAMYGILVERARRVTVRDNHLAGDARVTFGLRGDPLRLWETEDSLIIGNHVTDGRDVVVWYSSRNRISQNHVRGGRYGTHLMYSHDNRIDGNLYEHGVVGVFVMYSRRVVIEGNVILGATGSAGIGVGLKDSGDVTVEQNRFLHDAVGLFIDNSPSVAGEHNRILDNELRFCDAAAVFHSSGERNLFRGNSFADNAAQVRTEGGGDTRAVTWEGNYFDDYSGYDLDRDGVGDVAYELRSAAGELVGRHPELAFFRGTPTLGLADAASRLVPLLVPSVLLVDPTPRMAPMTLRKDAHAHRAP